MDKQKIVKIIIGLVLLGVLIYVLNWVFEKFTTDEKKDPSDKKKNKTSYELGGASSNCTSLSEVDFNYKRDVIVDRVWWGTGYSLAEKEAIRQEFWRQGDNDSNPAWQRFAYDKMLLDGYCTHNSQ